ncbi:sorting nexin-8 [Lepeophtheirus salmonis]|uniref:sorting nexin-8 n=1 Tax=Lepeophtheirus salmonis TaxID=72036 RepID=UPI001AE5C43D|nr:sorting nexin-8-like [Lepeophtheirus salmonis]
MSELKDLLHIDSIDVEALRTKKKGIIKKYVEYNVSSTRYKSQVCRRYNDFYALYEYLINRYPYRLVPKLPPPKINALFNGADSDFIEDRRIALKRWLILISSHPVMNGDVGFRFFLTYMNQSDFTNKLKEEFGHIPDEYVTNPKSVACKSTLEITTKVHSSNIKLDIIAICIQDVANYFISSINKSRQDISEIQKLSQSLKTLTNESYFPTTGTTMEFPDLRQAIPSVSESLNDIAEKKNKYTDEKENSFRTIKLLQDVITSYKDLWQRKERNMFADHKKALEKIAIIKKKKLTGVPNIDFEKTAAEVYEQERIFSDFEQRQSFCLNCLAEEHETIFRFVDLLGNAISGLSRIESTESGDYRKDWFKIKETTNEFTLIYI